MPLPPRTHIITELGLATDLAGNGIRGTADITPELWLPGTDVVRTSVLLTWADVVAGMLSATTIAPRIAVTLDLDLHLLRRPTGAAVTADAGVLKAGRTVVVTQTLFTDGAGLFAYSQGTFVASPDPDHLQPEDFSVVGRRSDRTLEVPLAERVGLHVISPGRVEMPRREEGLNPIGAIQGGLVALAAEEAAASLAPGSIVTDLQVRYLRPFMVGPLVTTAEADAGFVRVRLTDRGAAKLGAVATARVGTA